MKFLLMYIKRLPEYHIIAETVRRCTNHRHSRFKTAANLPHFITYTNLSLSMSVGIIAGYDNGELTKLLGVGMLVIGG